VIKGVCVVLEEFTPRFTVHYARVLFVRHYRDNTLAHVFVRPVLQHTTRHVDVRVVPQHLQITPEIVTVIIAPFQQSTETNAFVWAASLMERFASVNLALEKFEHGST